MRDRMEDQDLALVRQCLSGSEQAWNEFYGRYVGLVRSIVKRRLGSFVVDPEDVTQSVFCNLVAALSTYDPKFSLVQFVATVAERACIQLYRTRTAAKRVAFEDRVDHHDRGEEGARTLASETASQEDQLAEKEMIEILRQGLNSLEPQCRELLRLRYHDELVYGQISSVLGEPANTLAVRVKRCVQELRTAYRRLLRRGVGP